MVTFIYHQPFEVDSEINWLLTALDGKECDVDWDKNEDDGSIDLDEEDGYHPIIDPNKSYTITFEHEGYTIDLYDIPGSQIERINRPN
jgi:hypothetical protein